MKGSTTGEVMDAVNARRGIRTISVDEEWTKECKPLIDWIGLHGVNPDDCYKLEIEGTKVTFHMYTRNPLTNRKQLRVDTENGGMTPVTCCATTRIKCPLEVGP